MIELRTIPGPTGRLLRQLLIARGVRLGTEGERGIVSWGMRLPVNCRPKLNEYAGRVNKFGELHAISDVGIPTVPFSRDPVMLTPPLLGRAFHHTQGKDIIPIL